MPYFTRAQQLGATQAMLGCNRGLAYDLLGQQALAQADYRAALTGADRDEARRRLALSLAISGDKANAIATLAPLSAKGDASTNRVRAFVLALTGDSNAAMSAINAAMPGSWSRVAPFMRRLPSLPAGEKAAAVNLGIFPDSTGTAYAYAAPVPAVQTAGSVSTDRVAGVDALLRSPSPPAQSDWQQPAPQPQPVQVAYAAPPRPATVQRIANVTEPKIWLQLASGRNTTALSNEFERMKSNHTAVFKGITGYLVQASDRTRLIIGPFRGSTDAEILAEDLHTLGIDAFRWTNSDSDRIVPIAGE
jgi:hypothetical protein